MRRMKFARFGGLSPVKYKPGLMSTYHTPPRRKGIFAFIWPHMDLFFVYWHDQGIREHKHHGVRIFSYDGPLWTHLCGHFCKDCKQEECDKIEWVGAWHCVTVPELEQIYHRARHDDMIQLIESNLFGGWFPRTKEERDKLRQETLEKRGFPRILDPYKRGLGGWMSKDHLEVFIEGKHLNKIR